MNAVGITENVKGDHRKFEIWYSGREEVYVVQVCSFWVFAHPQSREQKMCLIDLHDCRDSSTISTVSCPNVMGIINFKRSRLFKI